MNGRELYGAIYSGKRVDRLPVRGIGGWSEAVDRWRTEGLIADEDVNVALGLVADETVGLHPYEIKAGMDTHELRRQYPTLCLNGGIDKTAVAEGGRKLEAEFERRFRTAWELERYTPGLDHGAPPDISWANMQHYARLFLAWCKSPHGPK